MCIVYCTVDGLDIVDIVSSVGSHSEILVLESHCVTQCSAHDGQVETNRWGFWVERRETVEGHRVVLMDCNSHMGVRGEEV